MSDTPLRILQLYPKEDYFTGAAIQVRELALGLHARGHDVIIGTRPSDIWSAKTREAGVPHHALPMASEVDVRSVRRLVGILRAHRTQIVHAQKGKARTLAMLAGLFVRIPVLVLNRGDSFPLDWPGTLRASAGEGEQLRFQMAGQRAHRGPGRGGVGDRERAATELGEAGAVVGDLDRREFRGQLDQLAHAGQRARAQPAHPDRMRWLEVRRQRAGPVAGQLGA